TRHCVVDQQHHDCAHDCDNHAVDVQAGDPRCPEHIEQKSADESTDDSKRNIEPETLPLLIHYLASDKPSDQAEYDPADDAHCMPSKVVPAALVVLTAHARAYGRLCLNASERDGS